MKRTEFYTGLFIVFGLFCFAWVALSLGGLRMWGDSRTIYFAEFQSVSGIRPGAVVEIAGVQVGNATKLDLKDSRARLELRINPDVSIPTDSVASVRTRGLIGEKFIKLTPGGEDTLLKPGAEIVETESVVDLEELIGKFIYDTK